VGSAYDVGPDQPRLSAARALSPAARTPATALVWAEVFVGPDTAFRVEGSRLLQVFSAYLGIDTPTGSRPAAMCYPRAVGL
jgi:hypothetical protein